MSASNVCVWQFNSDTNCPELASDCSFKDSNLPQDCLYFTCRPHFWLPGYKFRGCHDLLRFDEFARTTLELRKVLYLGLQFYRKRTQEQPNQEARRARFGRVQDAGCVTLPAYQCVHPRSSPEPEFSST